MTRTKRRNSEWVTTAIACESLNIHYNHLYRLRDDGLLKRGTHWRDVRRPQSARPTYRWHLKRCEQALETAAEMRG